MKYLQGLLISALLAISATSALAQPKGKVFHIGILPPGPMSERAHLWNAFRQGLRELGYVEGRNINLIFPSAEVQLERLPQFAAELVNLGADVIVAASTPAALAAKNATKKIPIVFPIAADPVANGLVASLAQPGGNITGLSTLAPELSGKRLELLKELVPRLSRVAVFANPNTPSVPIQLKELEGAARALAIQLQPSYVQNTDDFERKFLAAVQERSGAVLTLDDPFLHTHRVPVVKLTITHRLPAMYFLREFVDVGGLMSYAANLSDMYHRTATFVDKILTGAKPAELPIEQPKKFEFIVNLKAAKAIGLAIPPNLLARADQVIK